MKKIYLILKITFLGFLLSACGGGGGGSSDASFDTGNTKISVVACTTPAVYTNIQNGDLLVKEVTSTNVTIIHNTNGTKKVCVVSGAAHLLRKN